jgi:hypothetical protein
MNTPEALAITDMTSPQFAEVFEHQLGIGLGRAVAMAGFRGAADHLGRQAGNSRQQGFGVAVLGAGVTLGEGHQGLFEISSCASKDLAMVKDSEAIIR